jgi:hypothetical protein
VGKSKKVINYAGGLPIALEVLGSTMYQKELNYDEAFQVYLLKDFDELHMPYSRIEQIWVGKKVRSSLMQVCCFFPFQIKLMIA